MKKIKFKLLIPIVLLVLMVTYACSKSFLDKPTLGTVDPSILTDEKGVQAVLIGAYALVDGAGASGDDQTSGASNWVYGGVAGDDAYKGSDPTDFSVIAALEDWSVTATSGLLGPKWKLCYAGAQRSNDVINTMALATGISAETQTKITAQARFLRAYYHFELKRVYGNIIYVDETVNQTNLEFNNSTDVYPKIEADLQFAIANLPATWPEAGRINVWGAKAMLAKVYMFEKKYSDAYTLLKDIIANGKTTKGDKYALLPHYFSNFNPAQKNSAESVFAAQTSVQDGSSTVWGGLANGNYGDMLNFPYNGGPGGCCGFYNPSQDLGNAFKVDATGLPLLDSWFNKPWVSDPAGAYTGDLDPRIDWTMGRKGIPYLDWGPHPGDGWIRNPINDGHFSPLKNVYAASQKDQYTDVGSAFWGPTELVANNVNIIRFADVLLWAAECAVEANELPVAMGYVNTVRQRVSDPTTWVYKNSAYNASQGVYTTGGTAALADKYKIGLYVSFPDQAYARKAVQFERRIELGMEGMRFFDLVRWGTAEQVLNAYYAREKDIRPLKANAHWTAGKNEVVPIPQGEIDNLNSDGVERVKQNPGYN